MATTNAPSYYGNLSRVALQFYISTGNPAELVAAYWYARYAARAADELLKMHTFTAAPEYASSETAYGRTVGYDFAVKVF